MSKKRRKKSTKKISRFRLILLLALLLAAVAYARLSPVQPGLTPGFTLDPPQVPLGPTPTLPTLAAAECVPRTTARQTGLVTRVIDGDTIDVQLANGETQRVRYIGMDTPERGELFFQESTAVNSEFVVGQNVTLVRDVSATDRFGRLLRYVFAGEVFVNYELVAQGYATAVTFPPDVACQETFLQAERTAREANLGLWAGEE